MTETTTTAAAKAPAQTQYINFNTALILCAITALMTLICGVYLPSIAAKRGFTLPGAAASNKVVYLDFERVQMAGMKNVMGGDLAAQNVEVQSKAEKFQIDLNAVIKGYADAGYVVINSKALIAATKAQDITPAVIEALGVK